MDQQTVRQLEDELEEAIDDVMSRLGVSRLPLVPSARTMHLMAKAAVAVYETAVENQSAG